MSVTALRADDRSGPRLALAVGAVAAVGGIVTLLLWWLAPAVPLPTRNPFGIGLREAAPSGAGLGAVLLGLQSSLNASLRTALSTLRQSGTGWGALLAVGFGYGVFHAAGPGHGKAIISSYIVASERALRRGIALSGAAALIQAAVAVGLVSVVFVLIGGTAATMSRTAGAVETGGFLLVAGLGLALVWRKAGKLGAILAGGTAAHDDCACGPLVAPERASWRSLSAVALGAGIRPCAGALVVLTLAKAQGLFAAGIAATLAMAAGTALTTSALAALSVYGKRLALRIAGGRGRAGLVLGAAAELGAAALVLVIGVALLAGYWEGGGGS